MAKEATTEKESKVTSSQKAAAKAKKEQEEAILAFRTKMQTSTNAIMKAKGVDCSAVGFDAPQGTNGALSTGVLCLDLTTGGGFPKHRMTTIAGDSGTGKSTVVQKAEGLALRSGLICHHLDLEGSADWQWMLQNGTDMNLFMGKRGQPKTLYYVADLPSGDASFRYMARTMDEAIKHGAELLPIFSGVYFHDSLPACIPESLLENDEKGSSPDLAILLSKEIPRIRIKLRTANAVYVAVNQIRENPRAKFGKPEYEPGGNAPTFYADMKLWFTRTGKAKNVTNYKKDHALAPKDTTMFREQGISIEKNPDGTEDRYFYTSFKTVKNRVFPPFKQSYFRVWTEENGAVGRGIDPVFDVIRFFEEVGMCQFNAMDEVILKGQVYNYFDLKQEILAKPDLYEEAQSLLQSGKAFELYFNRLSGGASETEVTSEVSPSEEVEQEQAEAAGMSM
jgi:RecA/RadA recombinase